MVAIGERYLCKHLHKQVVLVEEHADDSMAIFVLM
jgi:hypothetical protein